MQATAQNEKWTTKLVAGVKIAANWIVGRVQYLFSLRWIVDLVRWLVGTGGNIAESAFLLATLFVTVEVVAGKLFSWVIPNPDVVSTLNQLAVIAFTALPDLIIFQA